jgi:hypothetical protein
MSNHQHFNVYNSDMCMWINVSHITTQLSVLTVKFPVSRI